MRAMFVAVLLSVASLVAAQETQDVTLADVLLFEYPGVEWTLEEPAPPEQPSITLWDSDESATDHRGAREYPGQPERGAP